MNIIEANYKQSSLLTRASQKLTKMNKMKFVHEYEVPKWSIGLSLQVFM